TFQSIVRNANRLNIISMERITSEFDKIMCSAKPSIGIKLLFDAGLLQYFFPELCDLQGVKVVNGIGHKDNFYHTLEVLDSVALKSDNVWLRWAALLHDIAKPPTQRFEEGIGWTFHGHEILGASMAFKIFKRLRLPLDHKLKYVQKMINLHLRPISLTKEEITDSAIRRLLVDAGDDIDDLMILCESDITSKNEKKVSKYLKNYEKVRQKLKDVEEKDHLRNWQPPIDGDIIMKVFNLSPNKEVGIIKNAIREAILNGDIENNFDEAYNFMIDKGKQIGLHAIHPII
ncbi:MAG: HD domain-containing protein, partial [Saprospiraceae bacterium]|nr:HD domain-containing protein [Saprospiraceae bacterium]